MSSEADGAIAFAHDQLGKPYVYGATGPNSYDCSGLVQAAYKAVGVNLPRTTYQMLLVGKTVSKANLQPGDLVFPDAGHVQLYVGDGKVIEAPHSGLNVRLVPMWGFMTANRIVEPGNSLSNLVLDPVHALASGSSNLFSSVTNLNTLVSNAVTNTLENLPGVKQVETLGTVFEKLSDPVLWKRIGIGALGGFLVLAGFTILARKPLVRGGEALATDGTSEIGRSTE